MTSSITMQPKLNDLPVIGSEDATNFCTVVKQHNTYHIIPKQPVKDFFSASEHMQLQLIKSLWDTQQGLEKVAPGKGYQVHIEGDREGHHPFSMRLEVIGSRPVGSPIELNRKTAPVQILATAPGRIFSACQCVFCNLKDQGNDMGELTKLCEGHDCFVIKAKYSGKPLIVPNQHAFHWFDAPAERMHLDLLTAAGKVLSALQKQKQDSSYSIWLHVGSAGAQTIPHLHVHVDVWLRSFL